MKIWSMCFAYVLFFGANVAQGESRRALEMAECGYLGAMAVEQFPTTSQPDVLKTVISDVIDFTNLYYHLSGRNRPSDTQGITPEMYQTMVKAGRMVHERRIVAMSAKNSLKLSNRILQDCRTDLRLFGQKLVHG